MGDSLVACSTEFSGSVLIFSLATGSLVYELPGLHQPVKMCMTDFFLLTGGRGTWSRDNSIRVYPNQQRQANGLTTYPHGGEDVDEEVIGLSRQQQRDDTVIAGEHMSCCIDIWDLKTGDRLYSLIPRLPTQQLHQARDIVSILNNPLLHGRARQGVTRACLPGGSPTRHGGLGSNNVPGGTSSVTGAEDTATSSTHPSPPHRGAAVVERSPSPPSSPISAPLALLGMALTPDNSTLVVALSERSGEGREGIYCWDFSGSQLEAYHEQDSGVSTMIIDKGDLDYSERRDGKSNEDSEEGVDRDLYANNIVMQQVDSAVFKNMHQGRIAGKVWIGWQLDKHESLPGSAEAPEL